jgi:hypothetical protein
MLALLGRAVAVPGGRYVEWVVKTRKMIKALII